MTLQKFTNLNCTSVYSHACEHYVSLYLLSDISNGAIDRDFTINEIHLKLHGDIINLLYVHTFTHTACKYKINAQCMDLAESPAKTNEVGALPL
jgi:hypothetical protein